MGRKPNPLILEYFDRGAKLEDASNRYQHTCKSCGERFPKGRIDSLVNHLTKRCQSLSLSERTKIVLRLHDLGAVSENETSPQSQANTRLDRGNTVNLPFSPTRQTNFNGLNVLAEASRQVGQKEERRPPAYTAALQLDGKNVIVDPALEAEGLANVFLNNTDDGYAPTQSPIPSTNGSTAPPLPPIFSYLPQENPDSPNGSPHLPGLSLPSNAAAGARSPDLSSIAASANETLAQGMMPLEPDLNATSDNVSASLFAHLNSLNGVSTGQSTTLPRPTVVWPMLAQGPSPEQSPFNSTAIQDIGPQPVTQRAASFPRPIAINPNTPTTSFVTELGTSGKSQKPKVRGRFSADRRKEVQQVRKQGACIRCRMLKKPCSGETPCVTCQGVESARLWKGRCIRTKLAEEFTLYSVGLYSNLAYHDINNIKAQYQFAQYPGLAEVSHYEDSEVMVAFAALKGLSASAMADSELSVLTPENRHQDSDDLLLLDEDAGDLTSNLEHYLRKMAPTFFEREPSQFMRCTLIQASELASVKDDALLRKVLELWVATHILADMELEWKISAKPATEPTSSSPEMQPSPPANPVLGEGRIAINELSNPYSYALLCGQLRAAVEKRANQLSKSIITDLERRLVQRQQRGFFETLLVAVILLNCVERTCWLFQTWDHEARRSRWPLDQRPGMYAKQGEHFSDILHTLLKMRNLPPKTSPRPDNGVLETIESSDECAGKWFEEVKITKAFLDQCQASVFDPNNSRCLDGKFWGKILQPQDCYT